MNGPTQREWEELTKRVSDTEKELIRQKESLARMRGVASVVGFLGGLFAAALISALVKAIWG